VETPVMTWSIFTSGMPISTLEIKYAFETPFRDEEVALVNPDPRILEELKLQIAKHKRATPTDQLCRYPRNIEGNPWESISSFEASSFAGVIAKVQEDISRLKELIFNG
jgi:hypothetical protein